MQVYKNNESKLYKDLRHEILNEENNKLIYLDILISFKNKRIVLKYKLNQLYSYFIFIK